MIATIACLDCKGTIAIEAEVCPTCERPWIDMNKLARVALKLRHDPACTNRETAAVETPDGIRCNRLTFHGG